MQHLRLAMIRLLQSEHPMTVRQIFYRMVSLGTVEKTEQEYKSTVVRLLGQMRRDGSIPFGYIADSTRWMRKPPTYSSIQDALRRTAESYRRALWDSQEVYVEVWLEKEALAGVIHKDTALYDVPLMVTRGYSSLSFLHGAATTIAAQGKPTYLYYLGDHDPSGVNITATVERDLRAFAPQAEIVFQRIAVTPDQIAEWNLPTRPTKSTDSRSRGFEGESVEVDAIPPTELRRLVREAIDQHVDHRALEVVTAAEESERDILYRIAGV